MYHWFLADPRQLKSFVFACLHACGFFYEIWKVAESIFLQAIVFLHKANKVK